MALLEEYKAHTAERAELGVPPLALTAEQTAEHRHPHLLERKN